MAKTASSMLPLGTVCPDFELFDYSHKPEKLVKRSDFRYKPLLVVFMCNHCPFVIHLAASLAQLTADYGAKGLAVVGINSNDVEAYPDDAPEKMAEEVKKRGYGFPYLFDESQEIAHALKATCTPDFFLFDDQHLLVYRGQYDDSRPGNAISVTGDDLSQAIEAVLCGQKPTGSQKPSLGCNIKWKVISPSRT